MATPENTASRPVGEMTDDEALEYAIALSMQDEEHPPSQQQQQQPPLNQDELPKPAEPSTSQNLGLAQLDRRAMEQERLKRLASKRPRPAADDDQDDVVEISPPAKKRAISREPKITALQFPRGVVKKTWAYGYPRLGDDIKIEEVLQKDRLELALLSSFQWDDAWLMSKIDTGKTKLVLLAYAQNEAQQQDMRENAPPRVRFCFPPMKGSGSMHSKLQLLKYSDSLRIVIPSGNLVPYDWGETGVMENMVFLIDLPRLSSANTYEETKFSQSLARFLQEAGVDVKMIDSVRNYDFSETKNLGFVYTIPGGHAGEQQRENGSCGLGECVKSLGLATTSPIQINIVASSLGSLNYDFLEAMYGACQGDTSLQADKTRLSRKTGMKPTEPPDHLQKHMLIRFPTMQTVSRSRGGKGAGGTICLQSKWWNSATFPKSLVRDCVSTRTGMLMHNKLIIVTRPDEAGVGGWTYVGSANLSESAWGLLSKNSKLNCRNWECGVVIPDGTLGSSIPIPLQLPGRPYEATDEPWFSRQW
ncbi:ubiquitin interaction domain-containing protein [Emericellopsis atlantica]|uniref:Ubiquitin interaction domain-containing protein n=1 Tax=Emericellopsis atlantica TaxID=2614577 RepID=A0A9P8CMJ6_9HYPO|nr:ubiquitin interaction domain-containing protein [Emericellopsis atlantica]KAG9252779.1 ubiquitin interaction domain-containing protein [Emericellopsis atlantica]